MEYQEAFLESLNNIGDRKKVNKFHKEVADFLCEKIKGDITVSFDMNTQEIIYTVHIDYDDRYFSEHIKIDEIRKNCNGVQFALVFQSKIEKYYLSKIFN